MDAGELKVLEAELTAQVREIERIHARIDKRADSDAPYAPEGLAYQLHNLSSALEELCEIVARTFENHMIGESGYHVELLRRGKLSILVDEGITLRVAPYAAWLS